MLISTLCLLRLKPPVIAYYNPSHFSNISITEEDVNNALDTSSIPSIVLSKYASVLYKTFHHLFSLILRYSYLPRDWNMRHHLSQNTLHESQHLFTVQILYIQLLICISNFQHVQGVYLTSNMYIQLPIWHPISNMIFNLQYAYQTSNMISEYNIHFEYDIRYGAMSVTVDIIHGWLIFYCSGVIDIIAVILSYINNLTACMFY